jgi:putative membrane protein
MSIRSLAPAVMAVIAAGALTIGGAPASARPTAVSSAQDQSWLSAAMQGDRFEIIGGKLAQTHSTDADVRRLGRTLLSDHRSSLKAAAAIAHPRGVTVAHQPSPSQRWELDMLRRLHGSAFDRAYTTLEIKDHQQDIAEAVDESKTGANVSVVLAARKDIGMYHRHLHLSHLAYERLNR